MIDNTTYVEHPITRTNNNLDVTIECYHLDNINIPHNIKYISLDDVMTVVSSDRHSATPKKQRPYFNPCVETATRALTTDYRVTGVILFDLDKKDNLTCDIELIRQQLILLPEILFCFYSPSGGLKFAVYTADELSDKSDYSLVYLQLHDQFEQLLNVTLDNAMKNVNLGSFYGADKNAYYNKKCKTLNVEKWLRDKHIRINTLAKQKELDQQSYKSDNYTVNENDIVAALNFIPRDYGYADRMRISLALLDELSVYDVKSLLVTHWNKPDNSHNKHIKQIEDWAKSASSGPRITIKSFFYTAHRHGYIAPSRNAKATQSSLPATFNFDYTPVAEVTAQLNAITHDFFEFKKDVFVNITAGSGKTDAIQSYLFNELIANGCGRSVTVFVKTHEIAQQYIDKFKTLSEQHVFEDSEAKQRIKQHTLKANTKRLIHHFKGRYQLDKNNIEKISSDSYCTHPLLFVDKALFDKKITQFCRHCPLRTQCAYIEQFNIQPIISIVTHNDLFNNRSLWAAGFDNETLSPIEHHRNPHYVIIDEDIVCMALETNSVDGYDTLNAPDSIKNILARVRTGSSLYQAVKLSEVELIEDNEEQKKQRDSYNGSFDTLNYGTLDVAEIIAQYEPAAKVKYCSALQPLIEMAKSDVEVTNDALWINDDTLYSRRSKSLMSRFSDIPMMYLDATADKSLVNTVFDNRFENNFKQIDVKPSNTVKITQYVSKSYSRSYFGKDRNNKLAALAAQIIKLSHGKKIGIISYSNIVNDLAKLMSNVEETGYFGNIRGVNRFENLEQLYIIGRHHIGTQPLESMYRMLNGGLRIGTEASDEFMTSNTTEVFNLKGTDNLSISRQHYDNHTMRSLSQHFCRAETEQALHRLRLVHATHDKELFLFTNEVQRIELDVIVTVDSSDSRRKNTIELIDKVKQHIDQHHYIRAKPSVLAKAVGCEVKQVSNHAISLDDYFNIRTVSVKDRRNGREVQLKLYVDDEFTVDMLVLAKNEQLK